MCAAIQSVWLCERISDSWRMPFCGFRDSDRKRQTDGRSRQTSRARVAGSEQAIVRSLRCA